MLVALIILALIAVLAYVMRSFALSAEMAYT